MKHRTSSRVLLPLLTALFLLASSKAFPQAGGGSKGGVVLACFTSDPTTFMIETDQSKAIQKEWELSCAKYPSADKCKVRPPRIYSWPSVTEDRTDPGVGYASKTILFDAVNRLKDVQVAEYYMATSFRSSNGSEELIGVGDYRLHPLLHAINDLPASRKARPVPQFPMMSVTDGLLLPFPKDRLEKPALLSTAEQDILFNYVEGEESRLRDDRIQNTPVFAQMYGLVSSMFRGVPAFYTRLMAAHEKLGLIPLKESNVWGSNSDQWDSENLSAMTSLPNPPPANCLWMTAADRTKGGDIIYDRYLWHRMDIFQRVILQLHEEIYFMGSDAKALGLFQGNVEPTRFLLSHFLRGERTNQDQGGDFASKCAYYDTSVSKRTPPVKLVESSVCQISSGVERTTLMERTSIKGQDAGFLPASWLGGDMAEFVGQFVCLSEYGCPRELKNTWDKIARYYGPYSSGGMQALLANDNYFFGRYSTIDRLTDKRDKTAEVVTNMLAPYETLWSFCDLSGYATGDDLSGPTPPRNNPRRLERKERENLQKKQEKNRQENPSYIPAPGEPEVTKADLEEFGRENQTFKDLRKGGVNVQLQLLSQGLGLLYDFPDTSLSAPIGRLLLLKVPPSFNTVSDLEPNKGKNEADLQTVCSDVRKRRGTLKEILALTGTQQDPHLSFYEYPEKPSPLETRVPR